MKKLFIISLMSGVVLNASAFNVKDYDHPMWHSRYRALRFTPVESNKIIDAISGGAAVIGAVALIPGAAPYAGSFAAALAGAGGIAKLCTLKGTGFSLNIPLGGVGVPFLWANK